MFEIIAEGWSFDKDLQIIHADVKLTVEGDILVEEPLCVDVGLPAFLYSALHDVEPNRWAPATEWQRMPFFICGCGDPECRGFSFMVRHLDEGRLEFTSVEERQDGSYRPMESYTIPAEAYRSQALQLGKAYLHFVKGLDYKPYLADTVHIVTELVKKLEQFGKL